MEQAELRIIQLQKQVNLLKQILLQELLAGKHLLAGVDVIQVLRIRVELLFLMVVLKQ